VQLGGSFLDALGALPLRSEALAPLRGTRALPPSPTSAADQQAEADEERCG